MKPDAPTVRIQKNSPYAWRKGVVFTDTVGKAYGCEPGPCPTEYRCYIKEVCPICVQRVRWPHRGKKSFVLRATPRPGGTSREVSYSVRHYHTRFGKICKYPIFRRANFSLASGYVRHCRGDHRSPANKLHRNLLVSRRENVIYRLAAIRFCYTKPSGG